ncbi:MAG: Ig-like domain-containing protein [Gemmatimonadetes bacterium]|nr:Ig-like domain-containing protein [Gemmatimonadota bacterium]
MLRFDRGAAPAAAAALLTMACNETVVIPLDVESIEVTPAAVTIENSDVVQLQARVLGANGLMLTGHVVQWTSPDPGVALVDETGSLRATGLGTTLITARVGSVQSQVPVEVARLRWIDLTRTHVVFYSLAGADAPLDQDLQVLAGGAGEVAELTTDIAYAGPADWLTASLAAATTPTLLGLRVAPGNLPTGTYSATVNVSSPRVDPRSLVVTLHVSAVYEPRIHLDPQAVEFLALQGGPDPQSASVLVTNTGGGVLSGLTASRAGGSGAWLDVSLDRPDAPARITLTPHTAGLDAGVHTTTVNVTGAGGISSALDVRLIIAESGKPLMEVDAQSVDFAAVEGGPDPAPVDVRVTNAGAGTLDGLAASISYTGGPAPGWLNTALSGSEAPATLQLSASSSGRPPGTYTALVQLTGSGETARVVTVRLVIAPGAPSIAVSAPSVDFTAEVAGPDPAPVDVQVSNSGFGVLGGLVAAISYAPSQPTGWLSANLSSATAPATMQLGANASLLLPGSYQATVELSADGAQPVQIPVSLTVQAALVPVIVVDSPSIRFEAEAGGSDPDTVTVQITNGGAGVLAELQATIDYGTGPTGWLDATLSATTAPASLQLAASVGSLAEGTWSASVNLSANGAATRSLNVTLHISAGTPVLTLSIPSVAFVAVSGGLAVPSAVDVLIANLGLGSLTGLSATVSYASGDPTGWLQAQLQATTAPTTLSLAASAGGLPAGVHTATVAITADGVAAVQLTATISVLPAVGPIIGLSVGGVSFTAAEGGPNPASVQVQVSNLGILLMTGIAVNVTYDSGQPTGWLTANLSGTIAPTTFTLDANVNGLDPGVYRATVTVTALLAAPRSFEVGLVVTAGSAPSLEYRLIE